MKPFNLEEAKAVKPIVTRGGLPARIICFDCDSSHPIITLLRSTDSRDKEDHEFSASHNIDGAFTRMEPSNYDLMMASEEKTGPGLKL